MEVACTSQGFGRKLAKLDKAGDEAAECDRVVLTRSRARNGYALSELLAAAGLEHPQQLRLIQFSQRSSTNDTLTFAKLYPPLRPGELIDGTSDPRFRDAWVMARADSLVAKT